MKNNTRSFIYIFPLVENGKLLAELQFTGKCWQCPAGDPHGFASEPYGFEIEKVEYWKGGDTFPTWANVTGLYEYLLSNTNGVDEFENATIQHISGLHEQQKENILLITPSKAA